MTSIGKELYAIQHGARILVTGANGFIGSHVVQQLLSLGYVVRGTVRAEKPWLDELFNSKYGPNKFESVVVPNLSDREALSTALKDVSGVIHVVYTKEPSIRLLAYIQLLSTRAVLQNKSLTKEP